MSQLKLFALGSNGCGQLGIGSTEDSSVPKPCIFETEDLRTVPENDSILKIVSGGNHTIVLCKSGIAFASGQNVDGRCGFHPEFRQSEHFRRVVLRIDGNETEVGEFSDVAATWEASFFVVGSCEIFVCGSGSKGELGLGADHVKTRSPIRVEGLPDMDKQTISITSIVGGMSHIVCMLSNGSLYGWGSCRKGQLGSEFVPQKSLWSATRVELQLIVRRVVLGREFTFVLGDHGRHILLGDGKYLQDLHTLPIDEKLRNLSAGWNTIYTLSSGRLSACGRNDRGQFPPIDLQEMKTIAAGSEHCLALTTCQRVLAWGWGEHGNCGMPIDARGNVSDRVNTLLVDLVPGEVVTGIAAGCATSFIIVEYEDAASL